MSNIAESFQILYDIKENIKNSIEGKGVSVGDAPFTEYSNKIDEIVVDPMDGNYDEGYAEGFTQGDNEGYNRGFAEGSTAGEAEGYNQGYADGTTNGISEQKGKLTTITVDENGVYSREDGYSEVTVNVDTDYYYEEGFNNGFSSGKTEGQTEGYNSGYGAGKTDGISEGYDNGYNAGRTDGYEIGKTDGENEIKANMQSITITENGPYSDERGYKQVIVNVVGDPNAGYDEGYSTGYDNGYADGYTQGESEGHSDGYAEGLDDGAEEQKALLEEITIIENGLYEKEDGYNKVNVEVPDPELQELIVSIPANGNYRYKPTKYGYSLVSIAVDVEDVGKYDEGYTDGYTVGYESGVTDGQNEIINKTIELTVTENGTYPTSNNVFFNSVTVAVPQSTDIQGAYDSGYADGYEDGIANSDGTIVFKPSSTSFNLSSTVVDGNVVIDMSNLTVLRSKLQYTYFNNRKSPLLLNTNNLTNASGLFDYANFEEALYFDTSNVTDMSYMFTFNSGLTVVPLYNTSNVANMSYMFNGCTNLESVPQFDTNSVTNMSYMFNGCTNLKNVPQFDTSNVTVMRSMFGYCKNLKTIPHLNFSNATDLKYTFVGCTSLTNLGGFEGLKCDIDLSVSNLITRDSVLNVFNGLATVDIEQTITLSQVVYNILTDDDKAIATNKGWVISIS